MQVRTKNRISSVKTKKNIAILGSTGSIGTQTLDIIAEYPDRFHAFLLTANRNVTLLTEQALRFEPEYVIIADESKYAELSANLKGSNTMVLGGAKAIADAMSIADIDMVVTAMVGYSGLEPTIEAIKHGKDIALSNKETLVVAGALITSLQRKSATKIYPVDSEHSAIFQCLAGETHESIRKLILTASGGPFRTFTKSQIEKVSVADALNHPNWKMGAKVTIDSASMMNKGFEIMEAKWLFDVDASDIEVVVHPQSIIHSMVEFVDGSVKAQLGVPDMRLPIRYALGDASRLATSDMPLTLERCSQLTFEAPDADRFPAIKLGHYALEKGGNTACVINAANEIAVAAFLRGHISFTDIYAIIEHTLGAINYIAEPSYEDYVATNEQSRAVADEAVGRIKLGGTC